MENKYYTPEEEEFHVGLEYEYRHILWLVTATITKHPFYNDDRCVEHGELKQKDGLRTFYAWITQTFTERGVLNKGEYRVKRLDREDIESLGWECIETEKSPFTHNLLHKFYKNKEEGFNTGSNYYIDLMDSNIVKITIDIYGEYGTTIQLMEFIIKNKSELKRILKQIGI